jgi:cation diffusion facilitator CzcD-associated flavoprotein CzcO
MPVVLFDKKFIVRHGPQYNPGERAMLTDEEALDAIRQEAATVVDDAMAAPPAHKQIKSPPSAKAY